MKNPDETSGKVQTDLSYELTSLSEIESMTVFAIFTSHLFQNNGMPLGVTL